MKLFSLTVCALGLSAWLSPALQGQSAENLVHNGDFEQGPWGGNAWRGQGKVAITSLNPASGAASLHVEGLSEDARVQGISRKIAVEPGATYLLNCQYMAPDGGAAIQLRWQGNKGIVYHIRKKTAQWSTLSEGIAQGDVSVTRYPVALGNPEEQENLWNNRIVIPEGVTEVMLYVTLSGVGVVNVDDVTLKLLSGGSAPAGAAAVPAAVLAAPTSAVPASATGGAPAPASAAASAVTQGGNLVYNGNFEQGPWGGNAWRGQGKVRLGQDSPAGGTASLLVEGLSADAQVQAISRAIAVEPGATYILNCQYRAPVGAAALQLRWQGNKGIVFQIKKASPQWQSLLQGITQKEISAQVYPVALGNPEGREHIWNNRLTIPQGVTEVTLYVTLGGEGFVNVDDVTLVKAASAAAQ